MIICNKKAAPKVMSIVELWTCAREYFNDNEQLHLLHHTRVKKHCWSPSCSHISVLENGWQGQAIFNMQIEFLVKEEIITFDIQMW